ncbi:acyltransferase family protein [Gephyromycinifex aptenodytis]|uniref:acyltransferase family protein n=1 Tax=Gephyromycinifex aptenodytis TaxID=2716227 RepID=UPI001446EE86|nr:acyltransferase family protein [Gephyromycinifex aptenodytis]
MSTDAAPRRAAPDAPPAAAGAHPVRQRIGWLDCARGAAVVAVVLLHVSIGHFYMLDHSSRYMVPVWDRINQVISVLRMPLLFVVSGMLASTKIARGFRKGTSLVTIVSDYYFYLVWLLAYGAFMLAAGDRPVPFQFTSFSQYLLQIVLPGTHLWFVFFLAVYILVLTAARKVPPTLIIGAAVALHLWTATTYSVQSPLWTRGLQFALFFVLGVYGREALLWVARQHWLTILTCGASVALYLAVSLSTIMSLDPIELPRAALLMCLYVAATLAAIGLAGLLSKVPLYLAIGSWVGRRTLSIYVMHIPVITIINFAQDGALSWLSHATATSFAFDAAWPLLMTAIVVAICVGLQNLLTRIGLGFLFALPQPVARRLRPRT